MKIISPSVSKDIEEIENGKNFLLSEESLVSCLLRKQDLSGVSIKAVSVSDSKFLNVNLTETKLEKIIVKDAILDNCNLVAADFTDSGWHSVEIIESRCSGAQFQMSTVKDVVFKDCKLDLTNFRFAKFKNVVFEDCFLNETDFYNAELNNVIFDGCKIEKAEFSNTKMNNVDFRTSELRLVLGIGSLSGAKISSMQLVQLAPQLAREVGLIVDDRV